MNEDSAVTNHAPEPAPTRYGCHVSDSRGQVVIHPTRDNYVATLKALVDDSFVLCSDLTAVDYSAYASRVGKPTERFEVVLNLISLERRERIRVRVAVPDADATLPSAFDLYPGTEAMEREVYDMFGITFTGHPDLSRILMPEDWNGHPLRKDYAIGRIPVQFKGSPS
ncbi:MAG: NADH-quinone oxidoreductase subunit C [Actinobacteria bacterium]|jgi:NADH-quinone oxidoreductase subunit C|nr:NADH-quinone oxidoreductase subunit C [Actinomycetota bacterium]